MRHAYMIMAHAQPELLEKLLKALDHTDNDFIIHLDSKSSLQPEEVAKAVTKGRVYFTERLSIVWGYFSMTRAEYLLLEKALEIGEHDYYHFITGQDFPLKNVEEINEFFSQNNGKEFISLSSAEFSQALYARRSVVKHPFLKKCGRTKNKWYYLWFLSTGIQKVFYKIFKPKWSPEKYLTGSQFFSITQSFAEYVVKSKEEVFKRHDNTLNADEAFIQMLVYNSSFKENLYVPYLDNGIKSNMRYIDWTRGSDGSPTTIDEQEVPRALESGMMFTRKCDIVNHPKAIEMLEKAIS